MTHQTTSSRPRGERAGIIYAFILLAVFTAAEVGLYYLQGLPDTIKVGLWVFLAAAKVALVLLFFMHLKSDRRVFDIPVALGIVLVVPLLLIVSLTAPQVVEAQDAGSGASSGSSSGGSAAASPSAGPTSIDVTETSFKISLSSDTVPAGKVTFLARDRMAALEKERNLKREGAVTAAADPQVQEFKGADYFLTGSLEGMSTRTKAGTSDYILYAFQLIDARTSAIVWEDNAEIKKQGLEDAAYR